MDLQFAPPNGRVALVTGAGAGIGFACAEHLAAAGHAVVLVGRSANVHESTAALAARSKAPVLGLLCDVGKEDQVVATMKTVDERFGRCDVLVNNAGVHPKNKGGKFLIEETETAQWNEVIAINLTAPFVFARAAIPMMRKQQWGRVVNIGSRGGRMASPVASSHYATTKAGMIGFTRILALEGAAHNITANVVAPGPVITGMSSATSAEARAAFAKSVPLGRYGEPWEVATIVAFLASDASSFITGAVVDVNGGCFMP